MFKLISNPEFSHDVPVMVPVDGGHEEQTLRARFRVTDADPDTTSAVDYLKKVFVGVEHLVDDAGSPVAWSDAVRDRLIAMPYVRLALFRAYAAATTKARLGN